MIQNLNQPSFFKHHTRKFPLMVVFGLLLTGISCKEKKDSFKQKNNSGPVMVDVIIAKEELVSDRVEVNGTVVANEFAELRSEVSGLLTFLDVPEGRTVQKGAIIARINSADLAAQVNRSKVQLALAEATEQRIRKLLDVNGINQAEYDAALNQVNTLKADIQYSETLIAKTIVKAPFTGVVGLRKVSEGSYITPNNVIATMQQLSNLRIDFTIPEVYQTYAVKGANIEVKINQNSDSLVNARIIAIEPQVNQSTRNITVRAILASGSTSPGSFVKVYLNSNVEKNSILIPANSIIPESKSKKVVVVRDGKASFTIIETGARQEDNVEVTKGLSVGDSVVVSGVLFTRPDAPVKVRSVKNLKDARQ
jgi:membrane fusion protein, multidrug efflux system